MKTLNRDETKTFFSTLANLKQSAFDGCYYSHPIMGEKVSKESVETCVRNELGKGSVAVNATDFWFVEKEGVYFTWKGVATHSVKGNHAGLYGFQVISSHGVIRATEVFGLDISEPPKPKELPAPKPVEKVKVQDEPKPESEPKKPETEKGPDIDQLIEKVVVSLGTENMTKIGQFFTMFMGMMSQPAPTEKSSPSVEEPVSFVEDRPTVIILGQEPPLGETVPVVTEVPDEPVGTGGDVVVDKKKVVKKQPKPVEKIKVQNEPEKVKPKQPVDRKGWKKGFKDLVVN